MRAFFAILVLVLVAQVSAREVVIPSQPVSPYLDTEVSTNLLLTQARISYSDLKFSFVGTRVNDLELSFGVDVNMNGVLEAEETETRFGWRGGRFFIENALTGERFDGASVGQLGFSVDLHIQVNYEFQQVSQVSVSGVNASDFGELVSGIPPIWLWKREWNLMRVTRRGSEVSSDWIEYKAAVIGKLISQSGPLADFFRHRFSTKYFDVETGLYYYGYRFYHPALMRWLNRDPLEEKGGLNLYAFCANNAQNRYDADGCAYFALRPLSSLPWLGLFSHNIIDDILNTEIAHEHLFFEDGKNPTNIGLHIQAGSDGSQLFYSEDTSRYRHFEYGYNDCVMRIAVANVKPKPYSLLGSIMASKYNCQDYCSDLRREYFRLLLMNSVRKKCCIGKR